jgi:hypothetical protein
MINIFDELVNLSIGTKPFITFNLMKRDEYFKWTCPTSFFGTVNYQFYRFERLKFVSQQYRALSDCTDMQAGLTLYWWQRLNLLVPAL